MFLLADLQQRVEGTKGEGGGPCRGARRGIIPVVSDPQARQPEDALERTLMLVSTVVAVTGTGVMLWAGEAGPADQNAAAGSTFARHSSAADLA